MKTILSLQNIVINLGGKPIIDDLSIDFCEGRIHALVGPNGAGKSTTASIIMGLGGYRDVAGDILFDGVSLQGMSVDERARMGITLAWQEPARYEGLLVRDFIGQPAKDKSEARTREVLDMVNLNPNAYIDRCVDRTLSGGERKRIELASILAMEPRFVLMDEPDSGIDVEALECIFDALHFFKESNATVVMITHSPVVLRKAEHAYLLCSGKLSREGSPEEVDAFFTEECASCEEPSAEKVVQETR